MFREDEFDQEPCYHIAIVQCDAHNTQCMDCLRTWPLEPDFESDFPEYDRTGPAPE